MRMRTPILYFLFLVLLLSSVLGRLLAQQDRGSRGVSSSRSTSEGILAEAIQRIENTSLTAKIRHQANLFNCKLVGSGEYRQLNVPDGLRIRYDLSIPTDMGTTSLRHINSGRFLWINETVGTVQTAGMVDLKAVQEATANRPSVPSGSTLSYGGLPRLLAAIERDFSLRDPQEIKYQQMPMVAIAGTWRPDRIKKLLPKVQGIVKEDGSIDILKMPPHFPDRVFILLGNADFFPYRIEYRRSASREETKSAFGAKPSDVPLLTMDLYRVNFSPKLSPTQFEYDPREDGSLEIHDRTRTFIAMLRK